MVDSNVLLDVATNDPKRSDWSGSALAERYKRATLILSPIIYAEVSIGYSTIEALNAALPSSLYQSEGLPWEAGFLAGKSFLAYRRRGSTRNTPLPDFYIGTHAAIEHLALLTSDVARYRTYFQSLKSFHLRGPWCEGCTWRAGGEMLYGAVTEGVRRVLRCCLTTSTAGHGEVHGQAQLVGEQVDLGRQTSSGTPQSLVFAPFLRSVAACW